MKSKNIDIIDPDEMLDSLIDGDVETYGELDQEEEESNEDDDDEDSEDDEDEDQSEDDDLDDDSDEDEDSEDEDEDEDEEEEDEDDFDDPFSSDDDDNSEEDSEEDFDEETERKLKEMEDAAHPGEAFKKLRAELKQSKEELRSLKEGQTSSEEFLKMKAKVENYDELQAEVEALRNKAAEIDYTFTPEWKKEIITPVNNIKNLATTLEKRVGLEEGEILRAVSHREYGAQSDAIADLEGKVDARTFTAINAMGNEMLMLFEKESSLRESASERIKESRQAQEHQLAKDRESRLKSYESSVNSIFKKYEDKIPSLISDDGKQSELYKQSLSRAAKLDVTEMSEDDQAYMSMAATLLPGLVKDQKRLGKELQKAKAALRAAGDSSPSPKGGKKPATRKKRGQKLSGAKNLDDVMSIVFGD